MALKLVIEPIFEPGQYRSTYAYRPGRRAHDAVAEIVHYINNGYAWVVEGDIEGCSTTSGMVPLSSASAAASPTGVS